MNIKVDNIKKPEIKKALKSLKNGKAAGIDEIPPEALNHGGEEICEILFKLLNKIWDDERLPTEWNKGLLVKLPKKRDFSCCENWRGITLLPVASKILCRVLLNRMKDAVDKLFVMNKQDSDQIEAALTRLPLLEL